MSKGKWLYRKPPVGPAPFPEAFPIRLTAREDPKHPFAETEGMFVVRLDIWFRDDGKPIGHDDQLSAEWRQNEPELNLEKVGKGLIALGEALVKESQAP